MSACGQKGGVWEIKGLELYVHIVESFGSGFEANLGGWANGITDEVVGERGQEAAP